MTEIVGRGLDFGEISQVSRSDGPGQIIDQIDWQATLSSRREPARSC